MPRPDESVRAYLLGLLPEEKVEAVEDAYFADPQEFDRVRAVEDDLLDDYAAGRLDPTEKAAFESRYLTSGPLRQRVVAARALRLATPEGVRTRQGAWRARARRLAPLGIAAGFLAAFGWAMFWTWQTTRLVPRPKVAQSGSPSTEPVSSPVPSPSPAASATPAASPIAPATSRLVLALSPTLLRSEGGQAVLRIPPGSDVVVLELHGDREAAPRGARLGVSIETVEGTPVWTGPAQRGGQPAPLASASVPAARLAPGDYLVALSAGDQVLHRYFFRILPR
jgi:hypothetical protein